MLLDGPMVFFATLALYLLARYCRGHGGRWLVAAAAVMGLAVLTKETAVVLLGGVYVFFVLTHAVKVRRPHGRRGARGHRRSWPSAFPLALAPRRGVRSGGRATWPGSCSGEPNHPLDFYLTAVPPRSGWPSWCSPSVGLVLDRTQPDLARGAAVSWVVVPIVFFTCAGQGLPVPAAVAPAVAVLAARALTAAGLWARLTRRLPPRRRGVCSRGLVAVVALSLVGADAGAVIQPSTSRPFLAGSGGLPGGREAGTLDRREPPAGARAADPRPLDGQRRRSSTATARPTACRSARTR